MATAPRTEAESNMQERSGFARLNDHLLSWEAGLGATAIALGLVVSEFLWEGVADFWEAHPMTASLLGGALLVYIALVLIDMESKKRREEAARDLREAARRDLELEAEELVAQLREEQSIVSSEGDISRAKRLLGEAGSSLEATLQLWMPVLLDTNRSREWAGLFAGLRRDLRHSPRRMRNAEQAEKVLASLRETTNRARKELKRD